MWTQTTWWNQILEWWPFTSESELLGKTRSYMQSPLLTERHCYLLCGHFVHSWSSMLLSFWEVQAVNSSLVPYQFAKLHEAGRYGRIADHLDLLVVSSKRWNVICAIKRKHQWRLWLWRPGSLYIVRAVDRATKVCLRWRSDTESKITRKRKSGFNSMKRKKTENSVLSED